MIRYKLRQMIGEKEFAERRHIQLKEVAKRSGVHRATLSKMLNQFGYVSSTDVLDKLCVYFGCRLEQLAEHIPDKTGRTTRRKQGTQ